MFPRWVVVGLMGVFPLMGSACTSFFPLAGTPPSLGNHPEGSSTAKAPQTRQVVLAVSGMT